MAGTSVVIPEKSICFGDCELNAAALELRRGRRIVRLERIPVQVLLILIQEHGNVVTREGIAAQVWGRDVFVDVDNGINTAIRKIRQVLNDDPQKPRFVETIPGVGYRFIAPLLNAESPPTNQQAPKHKSPPAIAATTNAQSAQPNPTAIPHEARRLKPLGFVVLALLSLFGAGGWLTWEHFRGERHTIRSIAVLPLQNLSGDVSQEYFSDGMTDELITELARIESLRVISHTSVMGYKGTKKHLPEIAHELGVDAILEGSVIRENNDIRVTVQLLDGPADRHLWGEEYERPLNGVLNLQRDVARAIAQEVRAKLTPAQQARLKRTHNINPKAYENYLRGRYLLSTQFTMRAPLLEARTFFENAIQEDANYAEAYSGLADAHLYLALFRHEAPDAAFRSAQDALRKAAELDDSIGEIHDTLGAMRWRFDWDWTGAEREFDRSIAVAPSYSCAHEDRAAYMALLGRRDDAIAELTRVRELDLGPSGQMTEAAVFYQLRDYRKLIDVAKQGIALDPNEWVEHENLGVGYEGVGDLEQALAEYKKAVELSNGDSDATASLMHAYAAAGNRSAAMKMLHHWERATADADRSPYLLAVVYASFGQKDKAFMYLKKAAEERNLELSWHFKADPRIDSIRSDPRFQALMTQMKFPI